MPIHSSALNSPFIAALMPFSTLLPFPQCDYCDMLLSEKLQGVQKEVSVFLVQSWS